MDFRQRSFTIDLIENYRNYPCLWDPKDPNYKDRDLRAYALEMMCEKYKQFEPEATVELLKKKMNALRTSFRRELNKVRQSIKQRKETYVSNLYYYDNIKFLADVTLDEPPEECNITLQPPSPEELILEAPPVIKKRRKRKLINIISSALLNQPQEMDEFHFVGKRIANQLKSLSWEQKIHAEKLMSDVMYYALLKKLSENSKVVVGS